ncbi:MAG: carboxymuconolactone decarboxylase family protein [Gammaproteobacteria bacterium]|nr:carboxymuconolactone decarboxylase family protein [Gammaproteobacteria bacterium]
MTTTFRLGPVLLTLSIVLSRGAHGQDRMPPILAEAMSPDQIEAVDELRRVRGIELRGPWHPLLRSPEVLRRGRALGDYLRFDSALPPELSEFLILLTAREWTQQYEWHAHRDIALEAGIAPATVGAIAEGRRPETMTSGQTALYELFNELHQNRSVSEATYAAALAAVGEKGIVDAVSIIGYYTLLAMLMNTALTPLPDGAEPGLAPLP